MNIYM